MMRKIAFLTLLTAVLLLSACGQETLKFRNLIEADQYMRNNITRMSWPEFQHLLSEDHKVTKQEFVEMQKIMKKNQKSSHVEVKGKFYRFTLKKFHLLYMTEWKDEGNLLYLKDIHFITK